jgi:hypothetical protein
MRVMRAPGSEFLTRTGALLVAGFEGFCEPGLKFCTWRTEEHTGEFYISQVALYGNAARHRVNPHDTRGTD